MCEREVNLMLTVRRRVDGFLKPPRHEVVAFAITADKLCLSYFPRIETRPSLRFTHIRKEEFSTADSR